MARSREAREGTTVPGQRRWWRVPALLRRALTAAARRRPRRRGGAGPSGHEPRERENSFGGGASAGRAGLLQRGARSFCWVTQWPNG